MSVSSLHSSSSTELSWRKRLAAVSAAAAVPEAKLRWWLAWHCGCALTMLPLDDIPSAAAAEAFAAAVRRLASGEPVQYVCGAAPFLDFEVKVSPDVLIPRPETEQLVHLALRHAIRDGHRVMDVGTGSGCIAIAIQLARPKCVVLGTDISAAALTLARENAECLGAPVTFRQSDLLAGIPPASQDVIVANLPYIGEAERGDLPGEVVDFEPHTSLFAGEDGTTLVVRLLTEAREVLANEGKIVLETGESQGHVYTSAAERLGWRIENHQDLAGRPRFWILERAHV